MNTEGWVLHKYTSLKVIVIGVSDTQIKGGLMYARFQLFMHFHAWDFTSFIILEGVSVSRSTIILSRGGGYLKYEKKNTNGLGTYIYVYTCIFTVLTLGPTLKHL